jgi:threonine/homoserine/homoserine lactone efflux protein
MHPLHAIVAASSTAAAILAAMCGAYLLLLAVVAMTATFHPDQTRRADARRVLTALLSIMRR